MSTFAKLTFPSGKKVSYNQKGKIVNSRKMGSRRKSNRKTNVLTNRTRISDHAYMPDNYRTPMSVSYQGYIQTASTPTYFDVYGNSVYRPFQTTQQISTMVTAVASSTAASSPIGYTNLSSLYNEYRVRASRIKVTVTPSLASDAVTVVVQPINSVLGAVAPPTYAMNERYSKWKLCTFSNNVKENTIIHYMNSSKALGLTPEQYDSQLPIVVGNAPAASLDWYWQVSCYTNSGIATVGQIFVTVELDLYVEWTDMVALTN